MSANLPPLYPIIGCSTAPGGDALALAESCLAGGAKLLQLREKRLADRDCLQLALAILDRCRRYSARLIINDRVDLALACGADGVHLGQDDLPPGHARRLLGPDPLVGFSTHNLEQFQSALREPADYIAVGPIFESPTKPGARPSVGLAALAEMARLSDRPLVAIGGIELDRAPSVWRAGADTLAVISDIAQNPDPAAQTRRYLRRRDSL